ncbi:lipid A export permease/ATP-binding protein MsbA [Pseudomethylobacillus aquaticus]|uniref:Lipid A export permease/ATP-binding protein MsbA n=1 Tax=Pseudomethylobacillus aquaticus TaxID=2676064 RepID=A0A3N0V3A0_9PROT|nr:lipid A export permease/ATP-binding protein MsbA [Pseudomethylobacillus aquaticus]ROH87287.1 lipid A export permease/ATP-binding protein MsbA [Pseudomethylobacillus aquaticus]
MEVSTLYNAKNLYLRLLRYTGKFWVVFAASIVALIILSATNTGFLATIKMVTDQGFVNFDSDTSHYLPLMLFGLLAIRAIAGFVAAFGMRWVGRRVIEALRVDAFKKLMTFPVSFFDAQSAGVITSKLTYDTEQISKAATNVAVTAVRDSLTILGMVGYMLYLDWKLTMIFMIMAPVMAIYLKVMTPRLRAASRVVQDSMGNLTQVIEEAVSGQRVVKIFGGGEYENARFSQVAGVNRRIHIRLARLACLNSMVIEILAGVALGLVVYYAIGKFTAGEFAAFIGALLMLIAPIKNLTSMNEDLQVGLAAADSVFRLIDSPAEVDDGVAVMLASKGAIEFRDIGLRYENAKRSALSHLSFHIQPGEKVALVGRSGGGKTTLINLLPRFYEFQQGEVLLDGVDIRSLSLRQLRQQFALVSQDVILFNDTVFNNIAYGVLRDASEERVIAAAKAAHAWEFIQQLPNGLQSEIGDRGVRLSGGQRQRLAIARAILKDAPILLLDEATSALDTESEQHVQAALDELMRNRTTLVIAHRLSTIENADRILVMEQGNIIESGSHAELMQLGEHYAKLYRKQFH